MKTLNLAVVCPVPELPQNTEQVRRMVWTRVAGLLQPNLGKLYDSFYPAHSAWGIDLNAPFSVLLGRDDPYRFLLVAVKATEAQNAALDFHMRALLAKADPDQMQQVGDALVCPILLDGTDKELECHSVWNLGIAVGELLPDCGIYYAEQHRALVGKEVLETISNNLGGYAVCVVRLEVNA